MRRYFILFLLLMLLIPCIAVPASASSWTDSDVENVIGSLEMIDNGIYTWFLNWYEYFFETTESIFNDDETVTFVTPFQYDLYELQIYLWSRIGLVFDDIKTDVSRLESYVYQIYLYTLSLPNRLSEWFGDVFDHFIRIKDSIISVFTSVEQFRFDFASFVQSFFRGDSSKADKFEEDISIIETEVDDIVDILETSPGIDYEMLDEIYGSGDLIEASADSEFFLSIFRILGNNLYFVIGLAFMLAIPGFLLYGKR